MPVTGKTLAGGTGERIEKGRDVMQNVEETEPASSKPQVRNFLTLCLSGDQKIARRLISKITGLGFYQTGEKQDQQFPGIWRFYFSIRSEDIKP